MPIQPDAPVGPIPDGADPVDYDKLRRRVLWSMPSGLYVLGTRAGSRRNAMTLSWATQVSSSPKLLAIAVEAEAFSHALLVEGGSFSLNVIARSDRADIRKFTKPVEVDEEAKTLNGFAFHDGETGVPILDHAVAFVECDVRERVDLGDHSLFIGSIVNAGFQQGEDTEVLRMEDTRMNYGG